VSMVELKVWEFTCDRCNRHEGPVFARHAPTIPTGWSRENVHNCGMTGYTRSDLLCWRCTKAKETLDA
jgi:hypothetical protein